MTAEKFDRRQWSRKDRFVYKCGIYELKGVDFGCGMVQISDGINKSFWVPFERVEVYKPR